MFIVYLFFKCQDPVVFWLADVHPVKILKHSTGCESQGCVNTVWRRISRSTDKKHVKCDVGRFYFNNNPHQLNVHVHKYDCASVQSVTVWLFDKAEI